MKKIKIRLKKKQEQGITKEQFVNEVQKYMVAFIKKEVQDDPSEWEQFVTVRDAVVWFALFVKEQIFTMRLKENERCPYCN